MLLGGGNMENQDSRLVEENRQFMGNLKKWFCMVPMYYSFIS